MASTAKRNVPSACCLAAGLGVYALFAVRCGGSPIFLALGSVCLFLDVVLPGYVFAETLFPALCRRGAAASLTFTLGVAVFALCAVAASLAGAPLLMALPLVAAPLALRLWRTRRPAFAPDPALCAGLGVLLCVLGAAAARFAHPAAVGTITPQQDFYWNVGNAESFLLGFPPQDLRYSGYTLTYHYLTELLAAGLRFACGISCYDALAFLLPPFFLLALVAVLRELGGFLWGRCARSRLLPAALLLLGGAGGTALLAGRSPFWNLSILHLATNINSVATATVFLAAFALLFGQAAKTPLRLAAWPAPVLALALLCAAKGPMAALAALAALCTVLLMLPRLSGRERAAALALAAVLLLVFGVFYFVLFRAGAGSSVTFSTHATLEKGAFAAFLAAARAKSGLLYTLLLPVCMAAQFFCMAPLAAPLFVLGAVRALRGLRSQGPVQLFCYALGFGGMAAFFLFDHPSMSQMYFACAALFAVDVNALDALPAVRLRPAKACLAALCALSVFTGLCSYGYLAKSGAAILADAPAAAAARPQYTPLTADEEHALTWLRENMPADEYFATNRMHTGLAEEGLSNVYSGLSGRRAYMESFQYAKTNLGAPESEIAARYEKMSQLFAFDGVLDAARALDICHETNVRWLIFHKESQGSRDAFDQSDAFALVYENDTIAIYSLT